MSFEFEEQDRPGVGLYDSLMFEVLTGRSRDLTCEERLWIVNRNAELESLHQRWLSDLYLTVGCLGEAGKILSAFGHWRKLGDLALAAGDYDQAVACYDHPPDREAEVFRGNRDWDRLISVAFFRGQWDEVVERLLASNVSPLGEKEVVLGGSARATRPLAQMISIAQVYSGRSEEAALSRKIASRLGIGSPEWKQLLAVAKMLDSKALEKRQRKARPKCGELKKRELEDVLEEGETKRAR